MLDRHALYELCVQDPDGLAGLLRSIHGNEPRVLGEDFCGTAALSEAWLDLDPRFAAIAVDHDPDPIGRIVHDDRLEVIQDDVLTITAPSDIIHAGSFSIGEWHARADLLRYLRHVRSRLNQGGVFVCDVYGGENAFQLGDFEQEVIMDDQMIVYTWEQREADPLTAEVINAIHFRTDDEALHDAFVYHWRLWSVPELRDAMHEAGFAEVGVYPRVPDAIDDDGLAYVTPLTADDLEDSFDVLVAARG